MPGRRMPDVSVTGLEAGHSDNKFAFRQALIRTKERKRDSGEESESKREMMQPIKKKRRAG